MENADIEELFAGLGPVTIKRLFGGKGIYHRGLIVGAVMRGDVLLKGDAETEAVYLAAGATQWVYEFKRGNVVRMPYWTIPAEVYDDHETLTTWLRLAFGAARRAELSGGKSGTKQRG